MSNNLWHWLCLLPSLQVMTEWNNVKNIEGLDHSYLLITKVNIRHYMFNFGWKHAHSTLIISVISHCKTIAALCLIQYDEIRPSLVNCNVYSSGTCVKSEVRLNLFTVKHASWQRIRDKVGTKMSGMKYILHWAALGRLRLMPMRPELNANFFHFIPGFDSATNVWIHCKEACCIQLEEASLPW